MNCICKIFGHRFVANIYDKHTFDDMYSKTTLTTPICKRCGLTINLIQNMENKRWKEQYYLEFGM